jgi:hypothetical protein
MIANFEEQEKLKQKPGFPDSNELKTNYLWQIRNILNIPNIFNFTFVQFFSKVTTDPAFI